MTRIESLRAAIESLGRIDGSLDALAIGADATHDEVAYHPEVYFRLRNSVLGFEFGDLTDMLDWYAATYRVAVRIRRDRRLRIGLPL